MDSTELVVNRSRILLSARKVKAVANRKAREGGPSDAIDHEVKEAKAVYDAALKKFFEAVELFENVRSK